MKRLDINYEKIRKAQQIARYCLDNISDFIHPGMTREELHRTCENLMLSKGSTGWWTHGDAALILFGPHTTYSAHLSPDSMFEGITVMNDDLVTIDVAPMWEDGWGDMARSYVLENGKVIPWEMSSNPEIVEGMEMEKTLHECFLNYVDTKTTFSDIHNMATRIIKEHGYRNCDYHGNYGHSIERHPDNRVTIIPEENRCVFDYGKPITFEPHIAQINGNLGFKYENMFEFVNGGLTII